MLTNRGLQDRLAKSAIACSLATGFGSQIAKFAARPAERQDGPDSRTKVLLKVRHVEEERNDLVKQA